MLLTRFKFPKSHFFLNEKRSQYRPRTSLQLILNSRKISDSKEFSKNVVLLTSVRAAVWLKLWQKSEGIEGKTTFSQKPQNICKIDWTNICEKKIAPMNTKHMMFSKNYQKEPLIFTVVEKIDYYYFFHFYVVILPPQQCHYLPSVYFSCYCKMCWF